MTKTLKTRILLPSVSTPLSPCSFGYSGASLWNSLPEVLGQSDQSGRLRRKSTAHLKHSIPTRQSCKSVFIVILIFTNHSN